MNPELDKLKPYPFERLAKLKSGINPVDKPAIALSIGEPKHPVPEFIQQAVTENISGLSSYPLTKGLPELREAISQWLTRRFQLTPESLDADQHVLPVNGTREALFSFAQAVINRSDAKQPLVLMPNPFYQIYEGAALLSGSVPVYLDCLETNRFIPDFDAVSENQWQQCELLYLCSPGNPTGSVIDEKTLQKIILLARRFDFIIASDECYSELYFDENSPPAGLLQAADRLEPGNYDNCIVFHSLSKRSNAPGLRSGFVAGDASIIKAYLKYRTYHGCAMPVHHQLASIEAWNDENHVIENRKLYRQKFSAVIDILEDTTLKVEWPDAGFYLWAKTPFSDTDFVRKLFEQQNITLLPGSFLSRDNNGKNPGDNRVRMALVAPVEECIEAARRIRHFCQNQPDSVTY